MPRALSSVRLDDDATVAYVLFIEGLTDAYVTDHPGNALVGNSTGSWIGNSETAIGGTEVLGTRRVRPGLIVPDSVEFAIDLKPGSLQPSSTSFQILDADDSLSYLFAQEGKEFDVLGQRIGPGTAAVSNSVQTFFGATTTTWGRNIGIERIGPAGQRRTCPAIPFQLIGFDHAVHGGAAPPAGLPRVLISDEPLVFVGRMAALYRVYCDPDRDPQFASSWYTWDQQHAAGNLVWFGSLQDAGRIGANDVWSLDCYGPDALLRRTLGTRNSGEWRQIAVDTALDDSESFVSITFRSRASFGFDPQPDTYYDSSVFVHQITNVASREQLAQQLNGWIQSALDGSSTNVSASGDMLTSWSTASEGTITPVAGVRTDGTFFIGRSPYDPVDSAEFGSMFIAMHRRAWMMLGFEPWRQNGKEPFEDNLHARFTELTAGEQYKTPFVTGINVPGSGYWVGQFDTITLGGPETVDDYDNGGSPRDWKPMHKFGTFVLKASGRQAVKWDVD